MKRAGSRMRGEENSIEEAGTAAILVVRNETPFNLLEVGEGFLSFPF